MEIVNTKVMNFDAAIRGMRNPKKSWDKSDSYYELVDAEKEGYFAEDLDKIPKFRLGENDLDLAMRLVKAGSDHRKFIRQIFVSMDVIAPLYWWKEYKTYKIGTTDNSTSTMHTITNRKLTKEDFKWDCMTNYRETTLAYLNSLIKKYQKTKDKGVWRAIIQDLPESFIYKRTCSLNYEVLRNIYHSRKNHKLDEWDKFCNWIEELPYSELIID